MTSVSVPATNVSFSNVTRLISRGQLPRTVVSPTFLVDGNTSLQSFPNASSLSGLYNSVAGVPASGQISFSAFANKARTNHRIYNNCFCHRNDLDFTSPSTYSIYFGRDAGDGNTLKDHILAGTVDRMYLQGNSRHFRITFNINGYNWNGGLWMFFSTPVDGSVSNTQMFNGSVNFTANVYAYKADTTREVSYTRA